MLLRLSVIMPQVEALERLFPTVAENSPVEVVRIACHVHEFVKALLVKQECKNPSMLAKLKAKEDMTRDHIKRLGSNLDYQEYQVCAGLLCYRKVE
jgi:hypothetical protein